MSAVSDRYRFTAYNGDVPCGHGPTRRKAVAHARSVGVQPSSVVLRLRCYPFTKLRRYDA